MATETGRRGEGSRVEYLLPLSQYERHLLTELHALLSRQHAVGPETDSTSISTVFREWKWSGLVKRCLDDDLGDESLHRDYQGDRAQAYSACLHFLTNMDDVQQNLARVQSFQAANPNFLLDLGGRPMGVVEVQPVPEDLPYWSILSRLYQSCGQYWKFEDSLSNPTGAFNVFELVRKWTLQWKWPGNKHEVDHILLRNASFATSFEVERGASEPQPRANANISHEDEDEGEVMEILGPLKITQRPSATSVKQWPDGEPKTDEDGSLTDAYLSHLLRSLGQVRPLEDPRSYIHSIPWSELKPVEAQFLEKGGIKLNVPFLETAAIEQWILWTPPHPGFLWNHHLRTEDQVYEYNVLENWPFPDHFLANQVVFAVRNIIHTDFIADLRQYWEVWNDCALTQKTANGPLLLLETIPGLRFRSRAKNQDNVAAMSYFRNIVEARASGVLDSSTLRSVIGLESSYTPLFEHSLRVIAEEQLHDINWKTPLGKGQNGAVYGAKWHKPAGILATSRAGVRTLDVVLKDVLPRRGSSQDPLKILLKELDVTYASLGGRAVGCVDFLGIALLHSRPGEPGDQEEELIESSQSKRPNIFLVFEQATQGTVREFISAQVSTSTNIASWDQLISALGSIAAGIDSLHRHGVLHRDLHMNNILVTDRFYPDDPISHEYDYMISDIGEGKILKPGQEIRNDKDPRASYGAVEFRAPEVHGTYGWSSKAEVFSFGIIVTKLIECRHYANSSFPPEWVFMQLDGQFPGIRQNKEMLAQIVPTGLKRAIEPCLSRDPESRPSMRDVVHQLDDLSMEFMKEKEAQGKMLRTKWTCWDWNETLRHARSPGSSQGGAGSQPTGNTELDGLSDFETVSDLED